MPALLIIAAFVLAGVLIILELFIPSSGVLTFAAAACIILGIVGCFLINAWLGFIVTIVTVASLPVFIALLVRIWPNTWIGQRVAIRKLDAPEAGEGIPDAEKLDKLEGQVGEAVTDLRPVGEVLFNSERVDCVAETGQIKKGSKVQVVKVEGVRVVVREQS